MKTPTIPKRLRKELKAYVTIIEMMRRHIDAASPSLAGTNYKVLANDAVCSLEDAQNSIRQMTKKQ